MASRSRRRTFFAPTRWLRTQHLGGTVNPRPVGTAESASAPFSKLRQLKHKALQLGPGLLRPLERGLCPWTSREHDLKSGVTGAKAAPTWASAWGGRPLGCRRGAAGPCLDSCQGHVPTCPPGAYSSRARISSQHTRSAQARAEAIRQGLAPRTHGASNSDTCLFSGLYSGEDESSSSSSSSSSLKEQGVSPRDSEQ